MTDTPPAAHPPEDNYRDHDVNLRAVLGFGGGLVVLVVAVQLVMGWWFVFLRHRDEQENRSRFPLSVPERAELPQTTFGSPVDGQLPEGARLEGLNLANPQHDIGRERFTGTAAAKYAREEEELTGYGKPGAARLPIGVAMWLVVEERKPQGREPAPVRYDAGTPGGGSNSGRDLPEGRR
jgi:hypothetical protein